VFTSHNRPVVTGLHPKRNGPSAILLTPAQSPGYYHGQQTGQCLTGNALPEGTAVDAREIRKGGRAERLAAMEALWDAVVEKEAEVASPDWHRHMLEVRKQRIESGKAEFISLDKLRVSRKA
jgi:hypothetical protein